MRLTTTLLLLTQALVALGGFKAPTFTLNADKSFDGSPSITVTFPDGYTDTLILNKHINNEEDRSDQNEDCNSIGQLAKEDVCVAMTGCPGQEPLEFTIHSSHATDSNMFRWNLDGNVEIIENPLKVRLLYLENIVSFQLP